MRCLCAIAAASVGLLLTSAAAADDYRGAKVVIEEVQRSAADEPTDAFPPTVRKAFELDDEIKAYAALLAMAKDEEALNRWLAIVDKAEEFSDSLDAADQYNLRYSFPTFERLLGLLPGPSVWPILARRIDERPIPKDQQKAVRALALRFLAHLLIADQAGQRADVTAMITRIKGTTGDGTLAARFRALVNGNDGRPIAGAQLHGALQLARACGLEFPRDELVKLWDLRIALSEGSGAPELDDLVSMLGPERAEPLLLKLFTRAQGQHYNFASKQTKTLIKKIVKEHASEITSPPVQLFEDPSDLPTLEAVLKRAKNADPYEQQSLKARLVSLLLTAGRIDDARNVIVAEAERPETVQALLQDYQYAGAHEKKELAQAKFELFDKLRTELPTPIVWKVYIQSAVNVRKAEPAIEQTERFLTTPDLNESEKVTLRHELVDAYLSVDRIPQAVSILRDELQGKPKADRAYEATPLAAAKKLIELGQITNDKPLIELVATKITEAIKSNPSHEGFRNSYEDVETASLLAKLDKHHAAEELLIKSLRAEIQQSQQHGRIGDVTQQGGPALLNRLAELYHKAGRHEDVVLLADEAPWWGVRDLADANLQKYSIHSHTSALPFCIASALVARNRVMEARPLVLYLLDHDANNDDNYELFFKLPGDDKVATLDRLFAHNPMNERPLIWKAKLLLDAGQLDESEKVARQAITIDPSDGEQGKGRRMMVYAVLADILEKLGKPEDRQLVETYRRAVKAIRMAEQADDWAQVGLKQEAIEHYKAALEQFADAYCIQSRLAVSLANSGQLDEAAKHFERAFELMPVSFGRMESHCFGCEEIFSGDQAQAIAERTLKAFAEKHPDNPQVFYLMGRLHQEEQKTDVALADYRQAVLLDRDYVNAWRQIAVLAREVKPPGNEEAELEVLRLGPPDNSAEQIDAIRDWSRLWSVVAALQARGPQPVKKLWPLAASTTFLDKADQQPRDERIRRLVERRLNKDPKAPLWPAAFIFEHSTVMRQLAELASRRN